ncbi:hypothetical protein DL95DRAFT_417714 [Leptodontidium sp. 2 PMI_412]|nr:hypothetical protein DL95DRAFT_417714 [Leptodontidium sp. 2 PMI_412]
MEAPVDSGVRSLIVTLLAIIVFHKRLRQIEPVYSKLMELKEKGWKNTKGDEHFKHQRQRTDSATGKAVVRFYQMMQEIGDEMQTKTGAFSQVNRPEDGFRILDLCMAPGGYTSSALKYNPAAKAISITLPPGQGGHEVFLNSPRSTVLYQDITMFSKEFEVDEVPVKHPAHASFSMERPFIDQKFDLVICDGQVLQTHKRPEYRENVQPDTEAGKVAVMAWKKAWWNATFGGDEGTGAGRIELDDEYAQSIIDSFGAEFTSLAKPVWKIQADALSRTDFVQ